MQMSVILLSEIQQDFYNTSSLSSLTTPVLSHLTLILLILFHLQLSTVTLREVVIAINRTIMKVHLETDQKLFHLRP